MNIRFHPKNYLLLTTLILIFWIVQSQQLIDAEIINQFGIQLRKEGSHGVLLYVLVGLLFTSVGFPRQAVAFIGGYVYGLTVGVLLSVISTILGSLLTYYVAVHFVRPRVFSRYPAAVKSLSEFLADDVFFKTLIVRLLPVGSNFLTNLVAGAANVNTKQFFLGSTLGYLPQMVIFALTGAGVNVSSHTQVAAGILLFGISLILGLYLHKKYQHNGIVIESQSVTPITKPADH